MVDKSYPAAHSMDTSWFAVDHEGHVALLRSDEDGPVPYAWKGGHSGGEEVVERVLALGLPPSLERFAGTEVRTIEPSLVSRGWAAHRILVRLSSPRVRDLLPAQRLFETPSASFVYAELIDPGDLEPLAARGLVEGVWDSVSLEVLLGFYTFSMGRERYLRGSEPHPPLLFEDLPEALQKMAVHLPGASFEDSPELDPSDYVSCEFWYED
jgi:hypothetical protein